MGTATDMTQLHAWTDINLEIPTSAGARWWPKRVRRLRWFTALVVVAAMVAGFALAVQVKHPDWQCGGVSVRSDGVRMVGGECLGVTDGSFAFDDRFTEITGLIKEENDWAAAQARAQDWPLARIALLTTITTTADSAMSAGKIQSALEGAYVALHRANRTMDIRDHRPYVQLYLANEGARQEHWEEPVDQLLEMTDDEVPLVAVMGQGVSSENTMSAARRMSGHGIPLITGVTTADSIDHDGVHGLIRTAPSNTDFAVALRRFLDSREDLASAMLVYDSTAQDLYTTSLRTAYEAELGEYIVSSHQPFLGHSIADAGPQTFSTISQNICLASPDTVLFAGREPDLKVFIEALSVRACRDQPLTVLLGVTGTDFHSDQEIAEWLDVGNLEVYYAAGADPGWTLEYTEAPEGFEAFESYFREIVDDDPAALFDGYAATYHDALATAVTAVRIPGAAPDEPPAAQDVQDQLLLLNTANAVPGATGTLTFSANRGGNPGGKYVPIVPLPYPDDPGGLPDLATYVTPTD